MGGPFLWAPIPNAVLICRWDNGQESPLSALTRMNPLDTVVEFAAEVPIVAVAQQLHMIREWEEVPMTVSCIMGRREYIMEVCRQKSILIEQRGEAEREIERTRTETRQQRETLSQLVDRVQPASPIDQ